MGGRIMFSWQSFWYTIITGTKELQVPCWNKVAGLPAVERVWIFCLRPAHGKPKGPTRWYVGETGFFGKKKGLFSKKWWKSSLFSKLKNKKFVHKTGRKMGLAGPWWVGGGAVGGGGSGGGQWGGLWIMRHVLVWGLVRWGGVSKYHADKIQIWQYKVFYFIFSSAVDTFASRALPFRGKAGYQGCVSWRVWSAQISLLK